MSVEIFCCYARKDQLLLNDLKTHLMPLQRQGSITLWADTDIEAGTEWEEEIEMHLDTAQIILFLVSADFIASEYCYSKEMTRAMQRHKAGEAQVVPIILRSVLWEHTPFGKLQVLPTGARPVISHLWHNQDEALRDVAYGVQNAVLRFHQEAEEQSEQAGFDEATIFKNKVVLTGFKDLDRLIGGLQSSDLIIVEAPPATGKTNFALSIALHAAITQAASVGICSLEMNKERLMQRLISLESGIEMQRLLAEEIYAHEWDELVKAEDSIANGNIWLEDSPGLFMSQLRISAQQMLERGKVDLIIVDYVNLMQAEVTHKGYEKTGQEFREISRGLKVIARELNIPILALAQMKRKVISIGPPEPEVMDAQDNSIEYDADVVMYIYHDKDSEPVYERWNVVDVIVTKHRHGPLGVISLYCEPKTRRFRDLMINSEQDKPDITN